MPTGYTAKLADGDQSFEEFVWDCARAFGALVMMRDDPMDKPVPEKLDTENYYERRVATVRSELAEWSESNAIQRRAMYEAAQLANEKVARDISEKRAATRTRYEAMKRLVSAWKPPSSEHTGLQSFMLEQLQNSIDFDCNPYEPAPLPDFVAWQQAHESQLKLSLEYAIEEAGEERDRNESRQRWVDQLRSSVPQPVRP